MKKVDTHSFVSVYFHFAGADDSSIVPPIFISPARVLPLTAKSAAQPFPALSW